MLQKIIDNKRIWFGQTDRYNVRLDERNILIKVTKMNDCICLVHTCAHRVWKSKLVLCSTRLRDSSSYLLSASIDALSTTHYILILFS